MTSSLTRRRMAAGFGLGALAAACGQRSDAAHALDLLNVSYDPTREFYEQYNRLFEAEWAGTNGSGVLRIDQSHGGSGRQAVARRMPSA